MRIFAASRRLAFMSLLAFTGMILPSRADTAPPLPRKAPEFVFNMQDGQQLLLSSMRGKVVLIAFMHTTCPHCQALAPELAKIQKDYAAKGVQIVGVVINDTDDEGKKGLPDFNKSYVRGGFPVGWSKHEPALEFLKHPDPRYYIPMVAFVDRKGSIQAQFIPNENDEFFKESDKNIRAELDKILSGAPTTKAPAKTFTKTIESTVKPNIKK